MTIEELHMIWEKKNRGKAAPSEHDLQVACVRWFRYKHSHLSHLLFAIPNGGFRTAKTAALMKAEGQKAGVPDMFLAVARGGKHGLWIEMKNGKAGRLSDAQREMIAALEAQGYACAVCRNMEDFVKITDNYLI